MKKLTQVRPEDFGTSASVYIEQKWTSRWVCTLEKLYSPEKILIIKKEIHPHKIQDDFNMQ